MPVTSPFPTDAAGRTFARLYPRIESACRDYREKDPEGWKVFSRQLETHFEALFNPLVQVYGSQYDFYYHLESLLMTLAESWQKRPAEMKSLDLARKQDPLWFQSNRQVGGVCYVDLFAGNLKGLSSKIDYFKELGLTYLHLMPLFRCPEGENDGGYAISSYQEVDPKIGSMAELSSLARRLRENGISLVLDFVFNHTANEHEWALKARSGDPVFERYYYMFPDRAMPDAYEHTLREIFPDEHPGAFTWFPDIKRWVWTTFHSYQWDLNYSNPEVFIAMAREMLSLANAGVEVLRLDAVAFIWKQMGTNCENLPEAHLLIQAFNACARIAAPALLFKSEAIVHPDEVAKYIKPGECQLSYNPLLMALLWESLATRNVNLLSTSMRGRFAVDPGCAWVNYVRCHDDIGWTFSDEDAGSLGINGYYHRRFLNDFYTGRFEGSFARGLPFQENPKTGDCRISGTCASLAGLEQAEMVNSPEWIELAVNRILLIHSVIMTIGGIPLLYLGDELATLNDYTFRDDPHKAGDSRWVHRPSFDWNIAAARNDERTPAGRVFNGLKKIIAARKAHAALAGHETTVIDTGNSAVFGYLRIGDEKR
ncbi:MAG: amylosucrase, partial [Chloroflexi bacterium]|nr:amylosucrase [Chloroflexota bacterium]